MYRRREKRGREPGSNGGGKCTGGGRRGGGNPGVMGAASVQEAGEEGAGTRE